MTNEEQILLLIKGLISELPAAQEEAVHELAEHIKMLLKQAGSPVGEMALAIVGAEAQLEATPK